MSNPEPQPTEPPPCTCSDDAPSEKARSVPGLNRIGARLDDLRKNINQQQRWALRDWVEAAKMLVIVQDTHGLRGDNYVQFVCAHLPIEGKTDSARKRAAYELYLLGYANEGQPANGDLVVQELEAQEKLRPNNFEWPHWRSVTARLRKNAKEKHQGDGIPADETDETVPDEDAPGDKPVNPVATKDAENQNLREELAATQRLYRSAQYDKEEIEEELLRLQDELHRLRSDVAQLFSGSERGLWDAVYTQPVPEGPATQPDEPETTPEPVRDLSRHRSTKTKAHRLAPEVPEVAPPGVPHAKRAAKKKG